MAGDALALPFAAGAFDAVTISFGLRNVADTGQALTELLRVTRPGGKLVVCEFSHLPAARLNAVYEQYLMRALPLVARRLSGQRGGLRLPVRVDPGVARSAGAGGPDRRRRLVGGDLAEPEPRGGRGAPGAPARLTSGRRARTRQARAGRLKQAECDGTTLPVESNL